MAEETTDTGSSSRKRERGGPRILLGVTGSVAAVKAPEIACRCLQEFGDDCTVKVLLSAGGLNFWNKSEEYNPSSWNKIKEYLGEEKPRIQVIYAEDEWKAWNRLGDPVEHIYLRDWADIFVVAPLSAHTLAKIAHGLCDDTLSCVARAWDFGHYESDGRSTSSNGKNVANNGKPLVLVPAMNTAMWEHPLTRQQLDTIQSFGESSSSKCGVVVVPPQSKLLACGEMGMGALASVDAIVQTVREVLKQRKIMD